MINKRLIFRELTSHPQQSLIFIVCAALSMITLISLSGLRQSVNNSVLKDARMLNAGDIVITSGYDFSSRLAETATSLEARDRVTLARVYTFYSMVTSPDSDRSVLADIKIADREYPFYGRLELASGRASSDVIRAGFVAVEQNLLMRMSLKQGDTLRIGDATLTIDDIILREPDRPVNIFSFGPRIFISIDDLEKLNLVGKGSRIRHQLLVRVNNERELQDVYTELGRAALKGQEEVETFMSADSRTGKFFDNLLFFLSLTGIFSLLLAGIGIQSALTAFLGERERTIAIIKSMGGTSGFITAHYVAIVSILGIIGIILSLLSGYLLQSYFPSLFEGLLPGNAVPEISFMSIAEGLLLGFAVTIIFAFIPLKRLGMIKPSSILGKEDIRIKKPFSYYLSTVSALIVLTGLLILKLGNMAMGLYFAAAVVLLITCSSLMTEFILHLLRNKATSSPIVRQSIRGLFRPGNSTRAIIVTLTTSLTLIISMSLIELNLRADFIHSYPEDAPNLFFLDIQRNQKDRFAQLIKMKADFYPVVRARISSVNNRPIDYEEEKKRAGDNLSREFNLTYRDYLLPNESLVEGATLFGNELKDIQVSVLDTVVKMGEMKVGDFIDFNIEGVPLRARISSIRTRTGGGIQPFFYFVFREESLKDAPHTIFTALRVDKERIAELQNLVVGEFPNVNAIDMTQVVSLMTVLVRKLSRIIHFFSAFSIVAGILIIVSSVYATRLERLQEAVFFKILGAGSGFVIRVFALENILMGGISAVMSIALSHIVGWIICTRIFDVDFHLFPGILMVLPAAISVVTVVGLLASISILRKKPIVFLREEVKE